MSVLIIAEHNNQTLRKATLNTITAAAQLKKEVNVLVAGHQCQSVVDAVKQVKGVDKVWIADQACYAHALAESLASLIVHCATTLSPSHIMAGATTFGKNVLPRVAALLNVAQVSDIVAIVDETTYQRPIYAGNALLTVKSLDSIQVITVRATAFAAADNKETAAPVASLDFVVNNQQSQFVRQEVHASERPELSSADIVVSGGRGLQSKENFGRLMKIADRLGAAIGASRAAVDAGLAPNDFQVGQTGQVVAPKLYIAVGISGAIQHLAGMKDSRIIVAINKDAEAPIFQIADYGLVGDINEIFSQWETVLTQLGY